MTAPQKDVLTVAELRRMHAWCQRWEEAHPRPKFLVMVQTAADKDRLLSDFPGMESDYEISVGERTS